LCDHLCSSKAWIALELVGGEASPRDAIGARLFVTAGKILQRADIFSGASYGSWSDQRVYFGLGNATRIDKIEIHWPSGVKQDISVGDVDRIYTVVKGKGVVASSGISSPAMCGSRSIDRTIPSESQG